MANVLALPAAGVSVGEVELSTQAVLALLPLALLLLALAVYALVDLARAPSVRYLPKPVWVLVILFVSSPLGALAYLVFGRNRDGRPTDADLTGRGVTGHPGRPEVSRPGLERR